MVPGQVAVVQQQPAVVLQQQAVVQHQVPLVRQVPKFRITAMGVPSYRKDKSGHIVYTIRVTADTGQEWVVEKRYSQLDAWRNVHIRRSDLGWPRKHLFSLSERQLKERRYKLNDWFAQLVIRSAVNNAVQQAIYHLVEFNKMIATVPMKAAVATVAAVDPRGALPRAVQPQVQQAQVVTAAPARQAPYAAVAANPVPASAVNVNAAPKLQHALRRLRRHISRPTIVYMRYCKRLKSLSFMKSMIRTKLKINRQLYYTASTCTIRR